jgi:hypothetical protein
VQASQRRDGLQTANRLTAPAGRLNTFCQSG